ncbi:MAG: sulfite exporter TauE/SafE family protein [Dehalococcoidia bacterium]|nr:sulfite exporter TauE/SafE family protein [Dehalococcoidia bacterium]
MEITLGIFVVVAAIAFTAEYADASIGMGYGTSLTPVLMLLGFSPIDVIPSVLLGQVAGGTVGGYFHHRVGNVRLDFRPDKRFVNNGSRFLRYIPRSLDSKVVMVLIASGTLGAILGVFLAINVPPVILTAYIGAMVIGMGALILVRRNHNGAFSFKKLIGVGVVAAFNKGMTGGGYGPLVTGGQILSGRKARNSVGSTTLAEVAVVMIAFTTYLVLRGGLPWPLVAAVAVGSVLAGPFAALTVKKLGSRRLTLVVGLALTLLGGWILAEAFLL